MTCLEPVPVDTTGQTSTGCRVVYLHNLLYREVGDIPNSFSHILLTYYLIHYRMIKGMTFYEQLPSNAQKYMILVSGIQKLSGISNLD